MCDRTPATTARDGADARQEGSLNPVDFVGSFPHADFAVSPTLPEVAFLGRSNVGKSSLLNALVRRRALARTSKSPGKTRDCNVYRVQERLYLVDLPGYGYARVSRTERRRFSELIEQYLAHRRTLRGVVWLLDIRRDPSTADLDLGNRLVARATPVLVALTKADKFGPVVRRERTGAILNHLGLPADQVIVTSARSGAGVDDLREAVLALAGPSGPV